MKPTKVTLFFVFCPKDGVVRLKNSMVSAQRSATYKWTIPKRMTSYTNEYGQKLTSTVEAREAADKLQDRYDKKARIGNYV